MLIIGCDFHPGFQQVAIFDNQTGEYQERRLGHRAEAEQFYRALAGQVVRVGMGGPDISVVRAAAGGVPGTSCGWGMRLRSGPRWCGSRRRTGGTPSMCWSCCCKGGFRGSGCRV